MSEIPLKIFRGILWALAGVIMLMTTLMVVFVFSPEIFINSETLRWSAGLARKAGVFVDWDTAEVRVRFQSLLRREIHFEFTSICTEIDRPNIDACFDQASLTAIIDFSPFPPKITSVGPVRLLGGNFFFAPDGQASKSDTRDLSQLWERLTWPPEFFPEALDETKFGQIQIDLDQWMVDLEEEELLGQLHWITSGSAEEPTWRIELEELLVRRGNWFQEGEAVIELETASRTLSGPWTVDFDGEVEFSGGQRAALEADIRQKGQTAVFDYALDGSYGQGASEVLATVSGEVSAESLQAKLDATAYELTSDFDEIGVKNCEVRLNRTRNERAKSRIRLSCPLVIRVPDEKFRNVRGVELPERTGILALADLQTAFPPSLAEMVQGNFEFRMDPLSARLLQVNGGVTASVEGVPQDFPERWRIDANVDASVRIGEFQKLVEVVRGTDFAIPAPLNVMNGTVEVGAKGLVDLSGGRIPIYFFSQLDSSHQTFDVQAQGIFQLGRARQGIRTGIDLEVFLEDVKLALPRLNISQQMPVFLPDPRIRPSGPGDQDDEANGGTPPFEYRIRVRTPKNHPVRLINPLAVKPAPLHVDLTFRHDADLDGTLQFGKFPLNLGATGTAGRVLGRRDAEVQELKIEFDPESDVRDLDAEIRFKYPDYTILLSLLGTVEVPRIELSSTPPLPQEDLIATLFFGEPPGQPWTDADEESVSALQTALGKGLSLTALYFLASTPIQSVNYSEETGFVASVKLAEGTSLRVGGLGSRSETGTEVGIRKRLGPHWAITTGLTQLEESGEHLVTAFLEWFNRY